jgi:hypothetical protein
MKRSFRQMMGFAGRALQRDLHSITKLIGDFIELRAQTP